MNLHDHDPHEHVLRTRVLSCSCIACRNGTACPYFVVRQMTNHVLKLKSLHVARDDETLRSLDMQKLTIDMPKSELLHRGLSTTHKKKEDLIKCLSSHLSKVNN